MRVEARALSARRHTGVEGFRSWLPKGGQLPERSWAARHRGITVVAWLHVPVLVVLGITHPSAGAGHVVGVALVVLTVLGGSVTQVSRTLRASSVTLSLLLSTALLIHLFHGLIELHFHFFVVIALVALYQAWTPYLVGMLFVLLHHVVMGVMMPMAVYNHPAAMRHPVVFAGIHGAFVLAESIACLCYWKASEQAVEDEREQRVRAEEIGQALSVANREISDLLAMISHDLRAPLTVINGCAEVALDSWPDLDDYSRRTFMGKVQIAGLSLEEMLEETLTLSAVDADGLHVQASSVRLDRSVADLLGGLDHPLGGLDTSALRPVVARVDRQQLRHMVTNLVTNAVKYGAAPYAVSTRVEGPMVEVALEDSGDGVPADFVPRLFDRYTRAEEARRGEQRGTGLGLYLVRELARANGGTVRYERSRSGGARFVIALPMGPCLASSGEGEETATVPTGSTAPTSPVSLVPAPVAAPRD